VLQSNVTRESSLSRTDSASKNDRHLLRDWRPRSRPQSRSTSPWPASNGKV
jgi:hypothetical protein